MARVLISDKLSDEGLAILAAAPGIEFDHKPGLSADELKKILPEYDGLIIRSGTKVTADVVAAGPFADDATLLASRVRVACFSAPDRLPRPPGSIE